MQRRKLLWTLVLLISGPWLCGCFRRHSSPPAFRTRLASARTRLRTSPLIAAARSDRRLMLGAVGKFIKGLISPEEVSLEQTRDRYNRQLKLGQGQVILAKHENSALLKELASRADDVYEKYGTFEGLISGAVYDMLGKADATIKKIYKKL